MGVSSYAIIGVGVLASQAIRKKSVEKEFTLYDQHTGIPSTHKKTMTLTYLGDKVVDLAVLPSLPITINGTECDLSWLDTREEIIGYEVARTDSSNGGDHLHVLLGLPDLERVRLQIAEAMKDGLGIDPAMVNVFAINYISY